MNTIHSFTNDQVLTDVFHKDLRRARAAGHNMIPTKTGAAAAVGLVLPHLNGKLDGFSIRVPTINVSIVDLTFVAKKPTTVEEVNRAVKQASRRRSKGILEYNTEPLVSSDFNHNPASSIFDSSLTRVSDGTLVKVTAWYDNEWGFSNRMLDVAARVRRGRSRRSKINEVQADVGGGPPRQARFHPLPTSTCRWKTAGSPRTRASAPRFRASRRRWSRAPRSWSLRTSAGPPRASSGPRIPSRRSRNAWPSS